MQLCGYKDASAFLGLTVGHLKMLVHRKLIPHFRLAPRTPRFDIEELQRWLDARRVAPLQPSSALTPDPTE